MYTPWSTRPFRVVYWGMARKSKNRQRVASAAAMRRLGNLLARRFGKGKTRRHGAAVVGLFGNLGSGKTTFAQGFAKRLEVRERVVSPTFILLRAHQTGKNTPFRRFIHVDAYRMAGPKELLALGWKDLVRDPENAIVVEWAERVEAVLPDRCLRVTFWHVGENEREVVIKTQNTKHKA